MGVLVGLWVGCECVLYERDFDIDCMGAHTENSPIS